MQFAKAAWKFLVAIKDGLVLLAMLLFFAAIYAALTARPNVAAISEGALLLDLNGVIVEEPAQMNLRDIVTGAAANAVPQYRLRDVVHAIETSENDDRVKAVVLDLSAFMGSGQTSLTRVGEALEKVKKSGKPVYTFANFYSDDSYQLAAHASEIWMDPTGGIVFAGPGGNRLYYKNLIDQLGITANVYRVGTYKSAVEPFLRADQSPESKEAATALYSVLWDSWLAEVKKARPQALVEAYSQDPAQFVTAAGGDYAKIAKEQKLVDTFADKIAFNDFVAKKVGVDTVPSPDSFKAIKYADYVAANPASNKGSAIGVITVAGEIVDGKAGPGTAAGDRIAEQIYKGLEDSDLKALVVRVNSPGGSVFASEQIRLAIMAAKKKKLPIVVSMGDVAASGGYWVSMPADHIMAEPDTITGSIGIFAVLPSFEKALGKWGVTADGVQTTPLSGEPDFVSGFSDDLNTVLQASVENGYQDFIDLVAKSRSKTAAQVDTVGQGRVWDGGTARQLGLVDSFGGLDEAVAEAAKRAKLAEGDYHAKYLDAEQGFGWFDAAAMPFAALFTSSDPAPVNSIFGWVAREQKTIFWQALGTAQNLMNREGMQAYCMECGASSIAANPAISSANETSLFNLLRSYTASSVPR